MKNVYNDYELENDSEEINEDSEQEIDMMPQFPQEENAPKRRRRVEYDEHGRVRKDNSMRFFKIWALIAVIVVVNVYAFHTCGSKIF